MKFGGLTNGFWQVNLQNCSAKKLKICIIIFTFSHIFGHNFWADIHSAIIQMGMDLNQSLRYSTDVNAFLGFAIIQVLCTLLASYPW